MNILSFAVSAISRVAAYAASFLPARVRPGSPAPVPPPEPPRPYDGLVKILSELAIFEGLFNSLTTTYNRMKNNGKNEAGAMKKLFSVVAKAIVSPNDVITEFTDTITIYMDDGSPKEDKWPVFGHEAAERMSAALKIHQEAIKVGHQALLLFENKDDTDDASVEDDTGHASVMDEVFDREVNELLSRIHSFRRQAQPGDEGNSSEIQGWIDDIALLTAYGEAIHNGTAESFITSLSISGGLVE